MVGNSKVLTVSYGTFSCTLEGFDDSFDTMKAIAEYFRDLAAEDRYFGAEPPQPDAEVLARIAERELSRGVKARAEGNTVLLQPSVSPAPVVEDAAPSEPVAEAQVEEEEEAVAPEPESASTPVEAAEIEATDTVEDSEARETVETEEAEDATEKAQADEDTAGVDAAGAAVAGAAASTDSAQVDARATDEPDDTTQDQAMPVEEPLEAEVTDESGDAEESTLDADAATDQAAEEVVEAEVETATVTTDEVREAEGVEEELEASAAEEEYETEAVEEELEAEAVVADAEEDFEAVPEASVEEVVSDDEPEGLEDSFEPVDVVDQAEGADFSDEAEETFEAASDFDTSVSQDAVAPMSDGKVDAEAEDLQGTEADSDFEVDADAPADVGDNEPDTDVDAEVDEKPTKGVVDSLAAKLRRIQAVVGASRSSSDRDANSAYTEDEHAEDFSESAEDVQDEDDTTMGGDEDEAAPRVLRMKRADFEKAIAMASGSTLSNEASEVAEDASNAVEDSVETEATQLEADEIEVAMAEATDAEDEAAEDASNTSLSPEDEADLMAELAAAEAEAAAESDIEEAATFEAEAVADAIEGEVAAVGEDQGADEAARPTEFEDQETTMSRLMDEAEAKLGEPESRTRRDAYSHLKAAVAAKQAARSMGEDDGASPEKRENEYRADLAEVVRPRRAEKSADGKRTSRPSAAPLKLVASQRVDAPQANEDEASTPVRPRRIAADASAQPVATGFADFAKSAGVEQLSDMLEGAAAYITHAEGHAAFSRPQLMRVVQQAMPQGSFTREEGLRAFGTLLRQGRINKTRGGQFEVTKSTRFQPEARETRAAG